VRIPWLGLGVQVCKILMITSGVVLIVLGISMTLFGIYWVFVLGIGFLFAAQLLSLLTDRAF
jgi:hypothetical protein